MKIELKTNTMYVLSGLPGSGKSSFLKNNLEKKIIKKNMIISSDKIRKKILGKQYSSKNNELILNLSGEADGAVFSILESVVNEKAKEHLLCFIDACNVTETDRARWARIARRHNMSVEVLIFNESIETCLERNSQRDFNIPDEHIASFENKFERTSILPYQYITSDSVIDFIPKNEIEDVKIDIIGDVHGLYKEMLLLLNKLGYQIVNGIAKHEDNRKLLFLGDIVDRGLESIETLKFVRANVKAGHLAVLGNHEIKLINNFYKREKGEAPHGSAAVLKTFVDFLREIPEKNQKEYIQWLEKLPIYYVVKTEKENFVCLHGNIIHFDERTTLRTDMLYGSTRAFVKVNEDTDKAYQKLYNNKVNKYTLIRGHIPQISEQKNVMSLEEQQCFEGYLTCLRLDTYLKHFSKEKAIVRLKTDFNYEKVRKNTYIFKKMNSLIEEKLVVANEDESKMLKIFKYTKSVFFKNLWNKDKALLKARGLVLDIEGNIAQHPFTKVFNYGENDAGLDMSNKKEIIAVEKLNGFLGCISKHPFKNDLLITTTGSFDSDFVGYIKDFLDAKIKGNLLKYFALNGNKTLMFEVIHPKDPHIISYKEEDMGLWLIGARGLQEYEEELSEVILDNIAKTLSFKRPKWFKTTLGELKEMVKVSDLEGYMVREVSDTEKILFKFKTPYYLTTKFLGRMSNDNIKFMFSSPNKFKEKVDEEFYPIIDMITKKFSVEEFLSYENLEKISILRDMINHSRD